MKVVADKDVLLFFYFFIRDIIFKTKIQKYTILGIMDGTKAVINCNKLFPYNLLKESFSHHVKSFISLYYFVTGSIFVYKTNRSFLRVLFNPKYVNVFIHSFVYS